MHPRYAFHLPSGWHVASYGVSLDNGYAIFEGVKQNGANALDTHELWIVRLQDGVVRRVPAQVPGSSMATDAASGGWITHVEKTPRSDNTCATSSQAGCWDWSMYSINESTGAVSLLTRSDQTVDQLHVPLVSAGDGIFAWEQEATHGPGFAVTRWSPGAQPVHLLDVSAVTSLKVSGGRIYLEQSEVNPGSASGTSVINVVQTDGTLAPIAHYAGPCCAAIAAGHIWYMTGDRGGDGQVSTIALPNSDSALTAQAPAFRGMGIYTVFGITADKAVVSTYKGDYIISASQPGNPFPLTRDGPSHVVSRAADGMLAAVAQNPSKADILFVIAPS